MIQIKNLVKIYKARRKKNDHTALDDINITLPNKGLCFVLGKSGSGKSTLLNLIGGLDNITSGKIIVDGNDISTLKEKELCDYRNTHIGFVFQDYHLIDELSVYRNIVLALNLKNQKDKNNVKKVLEIVDLNGYEHKYPDELSGGERQRVAIARAIIKKPRIILADEPTGNLDPVTAKAILDILKHISKTCLVLVVSHNENDAYKYADRILKLRKGKIYQDHVKNPHIRHVVTIEDDTFLLPHDRPITDDEITHVNRQLEKKVIKKVGKSERKYIPYVEKEQEVVKTEIESRKLSFRNTSKLSMKFLKRKVGTICLSSFITSFVLIVLALAQSFITFNGNEILKKEIEKMEIKNFSMSKVTNSSMNEELGLDSNYNLEVLDSDIQAFRDVGVQSSVKEVLNYSLPIQTNVNYLGKNQSIFSTKNLFALHGVGTIITTEEELKESVGDKFEWIIKSDDPKPYGVYLPDYYADSLLFNHYYYNKLSKKYENILNETYHNGNRSHYRGYVNGIFNTGYKEEFLPLFKNAILDYSKIQDSELRQVFNKFYAKVNELYGMCYTFNENFVNDFVEAKFEFFASGQATTFKGAKNIYKNSLNIATTLPTNQNNKIINENGIRINFQVYNTIFGTSYTLENLDTFTPHTETIEIYRVDDINKKDVKFSKEVIIEGLIGSEENYKILMHKSYFPDVVKAGLYNNGLIIENPTEIEDLIDKAEELSYTCNIVSLGGLNYMNRIVDVFIPIFEIIALVLIIAAIFVLTTFSMKMIRSKMHDIGILKAIGSKNKTIYFIFGVQLSLVSLITSIVSTVGYYFLVGFTNQVLLKSLSKLATNTMFLDHSYIMFNPGIAVLNIGLIIILTAISLVIPILMIKKIEPVKIIKTKE